MSHLTPDLLKEYFTYHAPGPGDPERYQNIRDAAYQFSLVLVQNAPESKDLDAAILSLRQCVMLANASIALDQPLKKFTIYPFNRR